MAARHLQNLNYCFRGNARCAPRGYLPSRAIKKIAILRANALGDYIFTLPALEAIKHRYPEVELVLLGNAWHKAFLERRPGPVDRVVVVPRCNGIPHASHRIENPGMVADFFRRMRDEHFDVAFQMHGGGRHSNPFVRNLGARLAIGLQDRDAIPLDVSVPYCRYQNEVLRYLEVASTLDAKPVRLEPRVAVTPADLRELDAASVKFPCAVIHPGASDARRRWPAEKFARVGDALAAMGLQVYICGTGAEHALADRLLRSMHARAENLCGRLSLNAYAALLAGAGIMISNDTGPLHLARAVGTSTVGIYWIVNLVTSNAISTGKHRNCIAWNVFCPLCGADCLRADMKPARDCGHEVSLVDPVSVEEVLGSAENLLSNGG